MLDPTYEALASQIAAHVAGLLRADPPPVPASPWLNSEQASRYLGLSMKCLEAFRTNRNRPKDDQRGGIGPDFVSRGKKVRRYHVHKHLDRWLAEGDGS